jgi:hypothetical protein
MVKYCQNGKKWSKMVKNGQNWSNMANHGLKMLTITLGDGVGHV